MTVPAHLRYTTDHEWLDLDGDVATVGVTAYAADALGDVVFVGLPPVGATLAAGEVCGEIESTKSVSDLYTPVDGVVVEVNQRLVVDSGRVNADPYGAGWLFRVRVTGPGELLDADRYAALIEGGGTRR
jgi:glycine cleavage system H protein